MHVLRHGHPETYGGLNTCAGSINIRESTSGCDIDFYITSVNCTQAFLIFRIKSTIRTDLNFNVSIRLGFQIVFEDRRAITIRFIFMNKEVDLYDTFC